MEFWIEAPRAFLAQILSKSYLNLRDYLKATRNRFRLGDCFVNYSRDEHQGKIDYHQIEQKAERG